MAAESKNIQKIRNPTAFFHSPNPQELDSFGNQGITDVTQSHKEEIFNHPAFLARLNPGQEGAIYTPPLIPVSNMNADQAKEFGKGLLQQVLGTHKFGEMRPFWPNAVVPWDTYRINPKKGSGHKCITKKDLKQLFGFVINTMELI